MDNQTSGSNNKESNNNTKDTNKGSYSKSGSSRGGGSSRSSGATSQVYSGGDDDQIMPSTSPVRPVGLGSEGTADNKSTRSSGNDYGNDYDLKSATSSTTLPSSSMNGSQMDGDWVANISNRASEFESTIKGFVKQRPLAILFGALAIGFVANRFLSGKEAHS